MGRRRWTNPSVVNVVSAHLSLNISNFSFRQVDMALRCVGATFYITPHTIQVRRATMGLFGSMDFVVLTKNLIDNPIMGDSLLTTADSSVVANVSSSATCRVSGGSIVTLQHVGIANKVQGMWRMNFVG